MYNYLSSIKSDILNYIRDNADNLRATCDDFDELEERLDDDLWACDSVTGNASGSYTYDRATAREYVLDNMDLLRDAAYEYGEVAEIGAHLLADEWETCDVIIRCHLLPQAIADVLEALRAEVEAAEKEVA